MPESQKHGERKGKKIKPTLLWFLFSFKGRLSRLKYLGGFVLMPVLLVISFVLCGILTAGLDPMENNAVFIMNLGIYFIVMGLLFFWPTTALAVKRLHDFNINGRWVPLAYFVLGPLLGLIVLLFIPGTDGPNRYDLDLDELEHTGIQPDVDPGQS